MRRKNITVDDRRPSIIELGNHARVLQVLKRIAGGAGLDWYDRQVQAVAQQWLLLARQHLRVARQMASRPRDWRAMVSRSYYAAYTLSRAVRYLVYGFVKFDADDHKHVGDLPGDFPDSALWSTFLVELRKDRNIADYEPWHGIIAALSKRPVDSLTRVELFFLAAKRYLRSRGKSL